jgi:uncharacterized protein (TIGR03437 family)
MMAQSRWRIAIAALVFAGLLSGQSIITTVAGTEWVFPRGTIPAIGAPLSSDIYGLLYDRDGSLLICDTGNNMVFRLRGGNLIPVAGNGNRAFAGDGGPATQASLWAPYDIDLDSAGNLYIADFGSGVRKVAPNGIITRLAAGNSPRGIGADSMGNVYFVSGSGSRVFRVAADGGQTLISGTGDNREAGDGGPAVQASLLDPTDVAVDETGAVFILGSQSIRVIRNGIISRLSTVRGARRFAFHNGRLFAGGQGVVVGVDGTILNAPSNTGGTGFAIDPAGFVIYAAGGSIERAQGSLSTRIAGATDVYRFSGDGGQAVNAHLQFGTSRSTIRAQVAIDNQGDLLISDIWNGRIRRVTSDGVIRTVVANVGSAALAIDRATGDIVFGSAGIRRISASGVITTLVLPGTAIPGVTNLGAPNGIAVAPDGTVYFSYSNWVFRRSASGAIAVFAGDGQDRSAGDNGPAVQASLYGPAGIAIDAAGTIYVAEQWGARIRRVAANGIITTVASGLNSPYGLAFDPAGVLHFGDTFGRVVRRVNADGTLTTVAGPGPGFSGDGGPALSAGVSPAGIAFDRAGNLYIADENNHRVRMVRAQAPSFTAAPARITLVPGEERAVTLSSTTPGMSFTASASAPWVRLSPASGTLPFNIAIGSDAAGLAPGSYEAVVTITSPLASPRTQTINVTLTVPQSTGQPRLSVDTTAVSFSAVERTEPQTQQVRVSNSGTGTLTYTVQASTTSGGTWLSASAGSQPTATAAGFATITARPGTLAPGTYQGNVRISGAGQTVDLALTLSITSAPRVILLSQSALRFTAVAQGGRPLAQDFGVLNIGQGSMSWSAQVSTVSGANWLQITPASGAVERPYLDVSRVTVSIDASELPPGEHYGRVQVNGPAVNTPQILTVILNVLPPGSSPGPEVYPAGLIFTGVAGQNPGSQDVRIGNPARTADNFSSGAIGRGFTFLPTNASVASSEPTVMRVFPDFSSLSAGTVERGVITLLFGDGTARTVSVLNIVAPAGVSAAQLKGGISGAVACSSPNLRIQHRALRTGFTATTGQPTTIEVEVADDCGNRIGAGGTVVVGFSNRDSGINLTHIGNGVWSGTWRPVQRPQSAVVISVTAFATNGATVQRGQVDLSGSLSTSTTPTVIAGGVVHAASGKVSPIAPGSLITVYGGSLGDGVSQASALPLPSELNGIQVLLGDRPLPMWYGNQSQLNVQVPFDVPVNTQHPITVKRGSALSVPEQLSVAGAQPGIFTVNQQGTGQAVIVKSDQLTVAQAGTPAAIGEAIVIYCTGLGAVNPAVPTGAPAPSNPLSRTVNTPRVTIGGVEARVLFSGLTPGSAGLYQINAIVPSGITPGNEVPVVIEIAGQASPAVTMAVR